MAGRLTKIAEVWPNNSTSNQEVHLFIAEGLAMGTASLEGTEDITLRKISLAEAIKLIENFEIKDA